MGRPHGAFGSRVRVTRPKSLFWALVSHVRGRVEARLLVPRGLLTPRKRAVSDPGGKAGQ